MKRVLLVLVCAAAASCASPPVALYTLSPPAPAGSAVPLGPRPVVIAVARVAVPDDLDTREITVRRGSVLESRHTGRWASRLSLGVTGLLTQRLAERRPDALVTDQSGVASPTWRLLVNVSRLDVSADGRAVLEADWLVLPRDPAVAELRDRVRIAVAGPVGSDQDIVALTAAAVTRLAAAIDLGRLP
jgi:hypothetical protein